MATTGYGPQESTAFRKGTVAGRPLTREEREQMLKPYLPPEPSSSSPSPSRPPTPSQKPRKQGSKHHRRPKPGIVRHGLHVLIYAVVSAIFSIFFRFRRAYRLVRSKVAAVLYYHHRTPEFIQRDVKNLDRLPQHLSVIVDYHESDDDQGNAGIEGLMNDVCEIAAWTASAGIPNLSIYERTGKLKNYMPDTHTAISRTLESYFGPRRKPTLSLRAPHLQSYSPPRTPPFSSTTIPDSSSPSPSSNDPVKHDRQHLNVLLLSAEDGRDTLLDLTKTLSQMGQNGNLHQSQITADLIDAELREAVSEEPDLLILFSPTVVLKGYPPWQLRLTEIFHLPDNKGVNYQVFVRALHNFARAEMRLGR
ncbi:di-trans,poly-cis-decaprenylcistransferas-like protein [Clohesyomyces aquaticus]|uniref:ditrans,polycis-polyprenyl diphosphate synthase [(2E,6E)-farnesyldiphosphate specific] n=1 Tax=Clohesyomyces aquaticus TaxID=1231657 RepID=A0A1Y2AAU8_9PLEO|nr:di-trans,poly-cis-decaprenylcistransferas-like protein [Clohesyomyces aquaticus]